MSATSSTSASAAESKPSHAQRSEVPQAHPLSGSCGTRSGPRASSADPGDHREAVETRSPHPRTLLAMDIALNDEIRRLLDGRHFAVLATINPDGGPQTSAMWVARDGHDVLFSTVAGRRKHRNLERDPRASVTVIDSEDPYNYVELRGRVTRLRWTSAARSTQGCRGSTTAAIPIRTDPARSGSSFACPSRRRPATPPDRRKPSDMRMENLIRVTTKELPNVHAVERVWGQVDFAGTPSEDTTVTGDRKILRSTIVGCVLACGEDIAGVVQKPDTLGASRSAMAELAFWLDRLEEIGQEEGGQS